MPSSPGNFLMLCKQNSQPAQGTTLYQGGLRQPDCGTNHRIEHPRWHTPRRTVRQPHIDYVPFTASGAAGFAIFAAKRMKWIENFGK
jgi:hypothetical protein